MQKSIKITFDADFHRAWPDTPPEYGSEGIIRGLYREQYDNLCRYGFLLDERYGWYYCFTQLVDTEETPLPEEIVLTNTLYTEGINRVVAKDAWFHETTYGGPEGNQRFRLVKELCVITEWLAREATQDDRKAFETVALTKADIELAVRHVIAPHVDPLKRAALEMTPPQMRTWWQNLRACHNRQTAVTDKGKWRAVAHVVVSDARTLKTNLPKDRHSNYRTPTMLAHLWKALSVTGADQAQIEKELAETLSRQVRREEAKNKSKSRKPI